MDPKAANPELIEQLVRYRARLLGKGRLLEARAVMECIKKVRQFSPGPVR